MSKCGWTIDTLKEHFDALRAADQHALSIKEIGDAKALDLAREIQQYKDEKANELREQIGSERGLYVTKDQAASQLKNLAMVIGALLALATFVSVIVVMLQGRP